jgi:(5-formylfuran-3-yl)methyl phosphate transaminase
MTCAVRDTRPTCMGVVDKALALERSGRNVIHLEKGEPDFATPRTVVDSAIAALNAGQTRYTTSAGLAELRDAISAHYQDSYGVGVDREQVIVTAGSSPALLISFLTLLSAGDEVILPDPSYPSYRRLIELAGARPVHLPLRRSGFRYTAEAAARLVTPATKAIVVNFPSNPLGSVIDRDGLASFARLGPTVISDEAYHGLSYAPGGDVSVLEVTGDAIVVNTFSKAFAMTGWRLGYCILPAHLVPRAQTINQDTLVCASAFTQWAAIEALANAGQITKGWRDELQARRDCLVSGLARLGFEIAAPPMGAFYTFARLPAGFPDSYAFAAELLNTEAVAVTPGPEFGPDGEGYLRFSYATPVPEIQEGLARIERFLIQQPVMSAAPHPAKGVHL